VRPDTVPAGAPQTLVVGGGHRFVSALHGHLPDRSVLVVEHPQLLRDRAARDRLSRIPVVAGLVESAGVYGRDPRRVLDQLPVGSIRRVLPSTDEQSVVAAATLAAALGLPGAGVAAAEIFADKLLLRRTAAAAGLANPRWYEVRDQAEFAARAGEFADRGFVLKPSARSGSQGVLRLDRSDDLAAAWAQCTTSRGRLRIEPPPPTGYLIEERLYGPEVSVECLARDGAVGFSNITAKHVLPGRHPVEIGHVLPARLDAAVSRRLVAAMRVLVAATGFGSGVLHGEWILVDDWPVLVECAARHPGDRITNLISRAYGVPFVAACADVLSAEHVAGPAVAKRAAAVRFLTPEPGIVATIDGIDAARAAPGVYDVSVEVAVDDVVEVPRASSDRAGCVQVVGPDADTAWRRATAAADLIKVSTR